MHPAMKFIFSDTLCRDYDTTVISLEWYIYLSKKYKITPCDTANALGDTIFYRNSDARRTTIHYARFSHYS